MITILKDWTRRMLSSQKTKDKKPSSESNSDGETALTTAQKKELEQTVSDLGENGFVVDSDLSPITHWLSTGCTILDLAIADKLPGGFPAGRISHLYGAESTAKTVLAAEPLGSAQRQGGKAYMVDAEWTFDMDRATRYYGLDVADPEKWSISRPSTVEELFDVQIPDAIDEIVELPVAAMAVDSLSALPSSAEEESMGKLKGYGATRARRLSTAFRTRIY